MTWSTAAPFNTVRCIIFRWRDAVAPVASGIVSNSGGIYAPLSFISWVNTHKINVLYDQAGVLFDHGAAISAITWHADINLGNNSSIQLPLSGAGVQPQMDGIYILLISDDGLAPSPSCDLNLELAFNDA